MESGSYDGGQASNRGFQSFENVAADAILSINFNASGTRFATGAADHKIRVYDVIDDGEEYKPVEQWRAHNAEILDVQWLADHLGSVLCSIGEDNKFKLWREDPTSAPLSGRRFRCIYSQSPSNYVSYIGMEPFTRTTISTNSYSSGGGGGGPETWLALLARDGLLSILEPSEPDSLSSWRELDQLFPFGKLGRGIEPPLSLSWHRSVGPSSQAIMAGLDMSALSIAVSAGNIIKVLRAIRSSSTTSPSDDSGTYIFQLMLEIEVATSQINDIAWAPGPLRPQDVIAAACQDSTVRIIDVTSNPANRPQQQQQQSILDITSTSSINSNNNMNPNTLSPTKTRGDTSITTSTKQTPHRRSSAAASISSSSFNNTTQSNTSTGPTPSGIGAGLAGLSRNTLAASSSSFNSTSTSTSASTSTKNGGNLPPSSTGTTDRHRNRNRNEGTIPIRHSWEEVAKLTHGLGDSPEGSDGNNGNNSGNGSVGFGTGPAVRKVVWTYDGSTLASTTDAGKVHMWRQGIEGKYHEFAETGPV